MAAAGDSQPPKLIASSARVTQNVAGSAIAELCEHLTATETRYPGTDLVLRYEVKNRP